MKGSLQHIIGMAALCSLLCIQTACDRSTDNAADNGATVMLGLTTEVLGPTRTGTADDVPQLEKMNTLRIVILHPDGTVEHNRYIDFGQTVRSEYTQFLEVRQNEKKSVCLIANENSASGLHETLEAYPAGSHGFKDAVGGFAFAPDYSRPLPMSSEYEIETGKEAQECRFSLVRAATKFTFRFTNRRPGPVTVDGIEVAAIADRTYLMPRKVAPTMRFQQTADSPVEELYWIDWLKRVSDESQQNPDDKTLADKRGWILDYDVPETEHRTAAADIPAGFRVAGLTYDMGVPQPGTAVCPAFYLPESKNLKTASAPYGEQEYFMTLRLTDENNERQVFERPFDNLKALFRNTHVMVDIAFYQEGIQVEVIPYSEVVLEPEFGL
ncbi:MAG: hypothetical protein K2I62_06030 [Alistipes sp.]|nr:hypothetical protein [Alistipes sp.]